MRTSISLALALCLAGLAHGDPRVESSEESARAFDELVLTIDDLRVEPSSAPGPTRRTLRVRADGRMRLERSHPVLRFPSCSGRATRTEVDRLVALLPSQLPGSVGPGFTRLDPEGRSAFRLARKRGETFDGAEGLVTSLEDAKLSRLALALEGLARRLVATRDSQEAELAGRVVVRPIGGRFEVLVATDEGEVTVSEPLAGALRALKGYPVAVRGQVGVEGSLEQGRLLDPRPARLRGRATLLGAKPGLRLPKGPTLPAIGPRATVLAAARSHAVQVSCWRYRSGRILIDSVGARAACAAAAERGEVTVAEHAPRAALRVLHVVPARGRALVQASGGGRIGWIPLPKVRWSERAELPPPEGSRSLRDALDLSGS